MSKPATPKNIDPDKAYREKCPKGRKGHVRHRWDAIERGGMIGGIIKNKLQCKQCGAHTIQTLDYNTLHDIF